MRAFPLTFESGPPSGISSPCGAPARPVGVEVRMQNTYVRDYGLLGPVRVMAAFWNELRASPGGCPRAPHVNRPIASSRTMAGTDVEAGDIVYYNPMDSITIIYAPTSSVPTLTKMGEVTSDLAAFENLPDTVDMRIELQQ